MYCTELLTERAAGCCPPLHTPVFASGLLQPHVGVCCCLRSAAPAASAAVEGGMAPNADSRSTCDVCFIPNVQARLQLSAGSSKELLKGGRGGCGPSRPSCASSNTVTIVSLDTRQLKSHGWTTRLRSASGILPHTSERGAELPAVESQTSCWVSHVFDLAPGGACSSNTHPLSHGGAQVCTRRKAEVEARSCGLSRRRKRCCGLRGPSLLSFFFFCTLFEGGCGGEIGL